MRRRRWCSRTAPEVLFRPFLLATECAGLSGREGRRSGAVRPVRAATAGLPQAPRAMKPEQGPAAVPKVGLPEDGWPEVGTEPEPVRPVPPARVRRPTGSAHQAPEKTPSTTVAWAVAAA